MNQGRIIVITGAPGTGKSTASKMVAKKSDMKKSVHMYTDDFYHYLSKGAIAPHLPESKEQNLIVIEAFLEAAKRYARGGYDVIVDGIIGPWFLKPWINIVQEGYEVHYIILRASQIPRSKLRGIKFAAQQSCGVFDPRGIRQISVQARLLGSLLRGNKEETMKRAVNRAKLDRETNIELVESMWEQFYNLGIYEANVIDTTNFLIEDTVLAIKEKIASKITLILG